MGDPSHQHHHIDTGKIRFQRKWFGGLLRPVSHRGSIIVSTFSFGQTWHGVRLFILTIDRTFFLLQNGEWFAVRISRIAEK